MNTVANARKSKVSWAWLAGIITLFVCPLVNAPASADSQYQVDWKPNKYKVVCNKPPCKLSDALKSDARRFMARVVADFKRMNINAPRYWGKRVGAGTDDDFMELYEKGEGIASASLVCEPGGKSRTWMSIGTGIEEYADREYLIYYFMAHEVFHLIQYSQPFYSADIKPCEQIPGWVMEGMATAVAQAAMRNRYPSSAPSNRDDREARNFAGLRRYDKPLPDRRKDFSEDHDGVEIWTGDYDQYRTSSFWRHLADAYYRGKYDFVNEYMSRNDWHGDWVGWLSNNIELGTGVHLGLVFAGFLSDYTGWGDDGFPGEIFSRKRWLQDAFGGCGETIYLDKNEPADYIDVDLKPLTGKCIEVHVSGLGEHGVKANESATVQVAATIMSGPPSSREGLHLGLATSTDKKRFHCAREISRKKKHGVGKCLRNPDDGKIRLGGGEIDARVWNVIPQEKGEGKGALVNLYTASYTPITIGSKHTKYGGSDPITARFYFVLDVAELNIDAPAAASTAKKKRKAVGSFAEGADPQTTLPKQDEQGRRANSYSLPESLRPTMPVPMMGASIPVPEKLGVITVTEREFDEHGPGAQLSGIMLMPAKAKGNGKYEPYALSVGETGEFPANFIANLNGELAQNHGAPGSLQVEEFTDLVFRGKFSGTVCRTRELKPKQPCPNPVQISGQIVKAFAGTRLPGRYMKIERTPGTEIYRKANEIGMAAWSTGITGSSASGVGASASGPSTGSGGALSDCACTCEEREATTRAAMDMKKREAAGEELEVGDIMGLNRCAATCQREYRVCAMEEGNKERAARQARQKAERAESAKDCDCSCTALQNLDARMAEILGQIQSGNRSAMDDMQKLGQCMSVCQDALMRCARSK